ncbi:LuxR C-terminal-related transcriptional regulator [Aliiglaciecola sp. 3_MG-2023]|uniref:response regulator transcription factor n=1 Tax=Aliiglaciecola sp. 3_MG-2023 TaxID=3062644 RepID=UPI0026E2BCC1|nr:helix-turn-helix transcriptional regulator [Aliiglaciecola sp. 3_MG-2023]MDO6694497.1 LuxR C-terminal-related transcriptional regulator [Aliiglaciecola sp. 3_MG-2023]
MHSTPNNVFSSSDQINLIDALGSKAFFASLVNLLKTTTEFDSSSAICYNKDKPPELLFSDLLEHEQEIFYARFLDGAYVASPAYQGFMNNASDGAYLWSELMPKGFKSSQMYMAYYQPSSIEDLLYFFVNCGDSGFIQFSIGRHSPNPQFSVDEFNCLSQINRVIIAFIRKHWEIVQLKHAHGGQTLSSVVSTRVNYLLNNFEPELLTARERQIAKLVITGHSSQSAADNLHISPGTERVHRAKLYAKLKLRSSSELFSYFLGQLTRLS